MNWPYQKFIRDCAHNGFFHNMVLIGVSTLLLFLYRILCGNCGKKHRFLSRLCDLFAL